MPRLNNDVNHNNMKEHGDTTLESIAMHGSYPVFICGVNRRVNTGNYEHIDIYAGLTVPIIGVLPQELDVFRQAVQDSAELGFALTSKETLERYELIRNLQKSSRPS